jgi:hypothetical protein
VLSLYGISETATLGLNSDLKSKVINTQHSTPVNILLSAAFAVITEVPGRGVDLIPERRVKVRQEEETDDKLARDQAGRFGYL